MPTTKLLPHPGWGCFKEQLMAFALLTQLPRDQFSLCRKKIDVTEIHYFLRGLKCLFFNFGTRPVFKGPRTVTNHANLHTETIIKGTTSTNTHMK